MLDFFFIWNSTKQNRKLLFAYQVLVEEENKIDSVYNGSIYSSLLQTLKTSKKQIKFAKIKMIIQKEIAK